MWQNYVFCISWGFSCVCGFFHIIEERGCLRLLALSLDVRYNIVLQTSCNTHTQTHTVLYHVTLQISIIGALVANKIWRSES